MKNLAVVKKIDKLESIEGLDKIWKATVDGRILLTSKDNGFKEGDLVVYLELDSWIPTDIADFLSRGKEPNEYQGVKGERLTPMKIKGHTSDGLILPFNAWQGACPKVTKWVHEQLFPSTVSEYVQKHKQFEGADLTEVLGILK